MIPIALNAGSVWPLGYFEINDIDLLVTDSTLEEDLLEKKMEKATAFVI